MSVICLDCIGNQDLRSASKLRAKRRRCSFCGGTSKAVTIEELAQEVDEPFRLAYRHGSTTPRLYHDSDRTYWEQDGDELNYVLQDEVGIEPDPAEALIEVLNDLDPYDPTEGDPPFYDDSQHFERADIHGWEFSELWNEFSERIKYHRRFFDNTGFEILGRIFGEAGSPEVLELPVLTIGPEQEYQRIFRARRADSANQARKILENPARELAAPPAELTTAGRMNSAGIPVFYGTFSEAVAVAEVRPSIGGIVVVGAFQVLEVQRLLDLTLLGHRTLASIFAPGYADRAARLHFLRRFHYLITRPVQASEEVIEYLPTQAVAEFLGRILGFDGLVYGSAQTGTLDAIFHPEDTELGPDTTDSNVVLFAKDPDSEGRQPRFAVSYQADSASGVWITRVAITYTGIDLSDERGYDADVDF